MKRIMLSIVPLLFVLALSGCVMTDDYYVGETVWYGDDDCPCHDLPMSAGQAPRVVPLDPRGVPTGGFAWPEGSVVPARSVVPPAPPLPPQTREPDLLK